MKKIFLDTDVILDFLMNRQPWAEESIRIFDLSEQGKIQLYASTLCFSNLYYLIRKIEGHQKAIRVLTELSTMLSLISVGDKSIKSALNSDFKDFEDAIQYFTASSETRVSTIVTRNIRDFRKSQLAVLSPKSFLGTIG